MEATSPTTRQIGVGNTLGEAFDVYKSNFGAIIGSAFAVFIVFGLLAWLVELGGGWFLGLVAAVVRLAGQYLYTGFVVRLVQDVRDGRRDQSVEDLFSAAMPALWALIVFGVLASIGIGIGFLLIVIPGLILLTFWSVGAPAIVVEGIGPFDAFGRSWSLVKGNAWPVFGVLFVTFIIVLVVQGILSAIGGAIGDFGLLIAFIVGSAIAAPLYALVSSVLYFDLGGAGQASPAAAPATEPPPPPPSA